ncbi:MAG TPA: DUF5606 domain-containing protein [Bacteroidales bacterium]|nr:DUF5606 domain-containing protein [Bacteroidales bacterium]
MKLKDILSISGHGGLFKFVSQGRNGIIVEGIEDKKRIHAHASAKISALEDIAIYTDDEEVALGEVFNRIYEKENGQPTISHKSSNEELKKYFAEILPQYDEERVYVSDMKKVFNWYNILQRNDMLIEDDEENKNDDENVTSEEERNNDSEKESKKNDSDKE